MRSTWRSQPRAIGMWGATRAASQWLRVKTISILGGGAPGLRAESFSVNARRPGRVVVRVRYTSHWRLPQAAGCVTRSPEGWTELHLRQAGPVSVRTAFAPGGDDAGGPRCAA